MYYPMMLDLKDKKITIIGGGNVACRRLKHFLAFNGVVTVISERFSVAFDDFQDKAHLIEAPYQQAQLEGSYIVVAATDNKLINEQIGLYCKAHQILCNVVSSEALSSFIMPSFVRRGDLVISVSTGGNSPSLASKIKKELQKQYTEDYGAYVALLGEIRTYVLGQDFEESEKVTLLKSLVEMNIKELEAYYKKIKRGFN